MEEDVASQSIGYGEASSSRKQLRERYPFIEKALVKAGVDPLLEDLFGNAARAYHRARMKSRVALYHAGDMPGFRAGVVALRRQRTYFAGVREDGSVQTAIMQGPEPKGEADPKDLALLFSSRFSDPGKLPLDEWPHNRVNQNAKAIRQEDWFSFSPRSKRIRDLARDQAAVAAGAVLDTIPPAEIDGPARHHAAHLLIGASVHSYQQRLGAASAHMMRNLDPEVAKIMRSTASYNPAFANWLAGQSIWDDRRRTVEPGRARNRQQAVASFPVLAKSLQKLTAGNSETNELAAVIDEGRPLVPALAASYEIKPATLRRMQGVSWQRIGRDMHHDPHEHLAAMDQLPPEHIPQSRKGAADLMVARDAVNAVASVTGRPRDDVFKSVGVNFAKVARDADGNPPAGIADLNNYLVDKLVRPGLIQRLVRSGSSIDEACDKIDPIGHSSRFENDQLYINDARPLEGASVRPLLQASARWHRALPRHEDELVTHGGDMAWKQLTGEIDLGDGITAHELTSQRQLKTEGARQDHCVGGYTEHVIDGKCLIYSLRKNGHTLSTVELDPDFQSAPGKAKPSIMQNHGRSNGKAPPAAVKAARALTRHIAKLPEDQREDYRDGLAKMQSRRAQLNTFRELQADKIGYDPMSRQQLENAWASLSEYLPKPARKLGLDGFIAREEKRLRNHAAERAEETNNRKSTFIRKADHMEIPF